MKTFKQIKSKVRIAYSPKDYLSNLIYSVGISNSIDDEMDGSKPSSKSEVIFTSHRPIDARKVAINYAHYLSEGIKIHKRKLKMRQFNAIYDAQVNKGKNYPYNWVYLECIDSNTGERVCLFDGIALKRPFLITEDANTELNWYKQYVFDTEDSEITVADCDLKPVQIIMYPYIVIHKFPFDLHNLNIDALLNDYAISDDDIDGYYYISHDANHNDVYRFLAAEEKLILSKRANVNLENFIYVEENEK